MSTRTALAEAFYRIETLSVGGVTGLNGATGEVYITSTDNSVSITPNTLTKTVNLSAAGSKPLLLYTSVFLTSEVGWEDALYDYITNIVIGQGQRTIINVKPIGGDAVFSDSVFAPVASNSPFRLFCIYNSSSPADGYTLELKNSVANQSFVIINPGEIVTLVAKGGISGGDWFVLPGVVPATDFV